MTGHPHTVVWIRYSWTFWCKWSWLSSFIWCSLLSIVFFWSHTIDAECIPCWYLMVALSLPETSIATFIKLIIATIRVTRYTKRVPLLPGLARHFYSKMMLGMWRLLWLETLLFSCLRVFVRGIAWYLTLGLTSPVLPFVKPAINSPGPIGIGVCVFLSERAQVVEDYERFYEVSFGPLWGPH